MTRPFRDKVAAALRAKYWEGHTGLAAWDDLRDDLKDRWRAYADVAFDVMAKPSVQMQLAGEQASREAEAFFERDDGSTEPDFDHEATARDVWDAMLGHARSGGE